MMISPTGKELPAWVSVYREDCKNRAERLTEIILSGAHKSGTICPRSLYPFYKLSYYIKWVKTFRTYSMCVHAIDQPEKEAGERGKRSYGLVGG